MDADILGLHFHLGAWDALGATGQALFASRFFVQWIASERRGESVVPVVFWWLSIVGSLLSLIYALGLAQPNAVFTAGYAFGCIPYIRNLILIRRKRVAAAARAPGTS